MIGVASNFCVADAMIGYLEKGAQVTVLKDLVKGIPLGSEARAEILEATGIDRTENGTIEEVVQTERFKPFLESGQLRLETANDFLDRVNKPEGPAITVGMDPGM